MDHALTYESLNYFFTEVQVTCCSVAIYTHRETGRALPRGKISGMWYYPPLSPACLESFGEGSITCRNSYPGVTPSQSPYDN
jgi:hypothetical protein